ncbi:MAG TPA: M20/M25/M40 family metallo-hydrolase [Solirubrobacter sp.]|nr:M20/M25/M40 family metallo-hydrolase [Solirubrobacter sp.]
MSRSRMALAAVCAATLTTAPSALADGGNVTPRDPGAKRFVENVSVPNIVSHQVALQQIASLNDETREVFSPGYDASLDYVVERLKAAGYSPKVTPFNYPIWKESQPPVLNFGAKVYRPGTEADSDQATSDFITMANSPTVELTDAPVFPVGGIVDPPDSATPSAAGCADADYAGVSGQVALVQRGTCPFVEKWERAQAAGATGIIIYNEGNTPDRQNPIYVDNQPTPDATIAAVISSYTLGNDLLQAYKRGEKPRVDFKVYGVFEPRYLKQVIAETRGGDPNNVVVVGAHLDSVPDGPGINDDGSGTATILAQAEEFARGHYNLRQKVRFAWWGAEENGLIGSSYYAKNLTNAEVAKIDVMLDYDMLASPNYIRGVYDGDGDDDPANPPGPPGSGRVEDVFDEWFRAQGMKSERGAFDGRSDYVGFTLRGIPSGGVFAGAEGEKTVEQEQIYGGAAGSFYDPCYHQICDNLSTVLTGVVPLSAEGLSAYEDNPTDASRRAAQRKIAGGSMRSLKELAGAASYAVYYWAMSRDGFNSKPHGGKPPKHPHSHWRGHGHRNRG